MNTESGRKRPWLKWFWICGTLAILFGLVALVRGQRMPALTAARLDAARSKWEANEPGNYEIRVEVRGAQPGVYVVTVENRIAVAATFDGHPLRQQRTFGTWAVVGMFDTLAQDLATNAEAGYLMLSAEFDEQWGFPRRYERIEVRTGAHDALQWEVTKFEVHK